MDEIDRALSDLKRAVLLRKLELTELSQPYDAEIRKAQDAGEFQQSSEEGVGVELSPAPRSQDVPISDIDLEAPAPKIPKSEISLTEKIEHENPASEARWTAENDLSAYDRNLIRETFRPDVDEEKTIKSRIRRIVERLKGAFRR